MPNAAKRKVAIIDFGMGNLFSVKQACEQVGLEASITDQKNDILDANGLILPGVGAFGNAIIHLQKLDLIQPIKDTIINGKPFLGICLGMQLLMTESEEFGLHKGLDLIKGSVLRFPSKRSNGMINEQLKVPQVGWNQIFLPEGGTQPYWQNTPLEGIANGEYMYFVHSYYVKPVDFQVVSSVSHYAGVSYCSSLRIKNIFAAQFHPEKSCKQGIRIYQNWASQVRAYCGDGVNDNDALKKGPSLYDNCFSN